MKSLSAAAALFCLALLWPCAAHAVEYTGTSGRDPFQNVLPARAAAPVQPDSAPPAPLLLGGIIWSPQRSYAVINGKLVTAGDRVGAAEVIAIDRENVKMRDNGREFYLTTKGQRP